MTTLNQALNEASNNITHFTDVELLDIAYAVENITTDDTDYPKVREVIDEEIQSRGIDDQDTFFEWVDASTVLDQDQKRLYKKIFEQETEEQASAGKTGGINQKNNFYPMSVLMAEIKETFLELVQEGLEAVQNMNLSKYSTELVQENIITYTKQQSGIDASFLIQEDSFIDRGASLDKTAQSHQETELYIEALKNISPVQKVQTNAPLEKIVQDIQTNDDPLLESKVNLYIKTKKSQKKAMNLLKSGNTKQALAGKTEKQVSAGYTKKPLLETPSKPLLENEAPLLEMIKNTIISEVQNTDFMYNSQKLTDDEISEYIDEGTEAYFAVCDYIKEKTDFDMIQKIRESIALNENTEVYKNMDMYTRYITYAVINENKNTSSQTEFEHLVKDGRTVQNTVTQDVLWYSTLQDLYYLNNTSIDADHAFDIYKDWDSQDVQEIK